MDQIQTIVVAIDFSQPSAAAAIQAERLARRNRARLHVVHVIEELAITDLYHEFGNSVVQADVAETSARERLADFLQELGIAPDQGELHIVVGSPFVDLLRLVRDVSADLLVLGSNGTVHTDAVGTVASKCVRKAPTKVMLVRDPHRTPYTKIVACVDFSEASRAAVTQAMHVARQDEASLQIVHAFTPPWRMLHYRLPTPEALPEFQKKYEAQMEARLKKFAEDCNDGANDVGMDFGLIECMKPAYGVIEHLRNSGADLVVLTTRGRTGLKVLLMGTTAERIVRDSPCSVLAIKPDDFHYDIE